MKMNHTNSFRPLQVQRHLQLRIEAQGKYLQSILEKAKETLAGHTSTSPGLEAAHAELTELASKVSSEPLGPSFPSLNMPGLNPPEASPHGITPLQNLHQLPRQQSRMSDSSSQKSYLTNLTTNPEDSGGASGGGEHHAAPGKKRSSSPHNCSDDETDDGEESARFGSS